MPLYVYLCPKEGLFEAHGRHDERFIECACGEQAERRPFSGLPQIKGKVETHAIPDDSERWHRAEIDHKAKGWDLDRAVRYLRKGIREDNQGHHVFDAAQAGPA